MAVPTDVDLNPFAVAVAVAGALLGPKLAQYVGAYSVILLGWFGGLLYGLYRRSADAKMPVVAYVVCTFILSLGVTVTAAEVIAQYTPLSVTALLFPVAALIPALPDKWGAFGTWLMQRWELLRSGGAKP